MTKKERFVEGDTESIEEQYLTDTLKDEVYWIDNGLEDIVKLLNELNNQNEILKKVNEQLEFDLRIEKAIIESIIKSHYKTSFGTNTDTIKKLYKKHKRGYND